MKKSQFSETKIVEILALPSQGKSVDEICRTYNISTATFYNWTGPISGDLSNTPNGMKKPRSDLSGAAFLHSDYFSTLCLSCKYYSTLFCSNSVYFPND